MKGGATLAEDGVVRFRRVDLKKRIARAFGVELHERSVGKLLHKLGYRKLSVRPVNPQTDLAAQEAFKNVWPAPPASDFSRHKLVSLRQRIRSQGMTPGQDGDPHVPVLIKLTAASAIF